MSPAIYKTIELRIFWLIGALILPGCSDAPPRVMPPQSVSSATSHLVEGQSSTSTLSTPTDQSGFMSLDPSEDGWSSEHLNAVAGSQLKKLASAFAEHGFADHTKLASLFTPEAACSSLRPADLVSAFDTDGIVVLRSESPPDETHPRESAAPWADRFTQLTSSLPADGERHAKFKIIRVEGQGDGFETTQLVSLNSHNATEAWEQNATWKIRWDHVDSHDTPKIRTVELVEFEEVHTSQGGLWFTDSTADVFVNEPEIAAEQFGVGVDQWVERLNEYQLVMQFGHNGLALGDVNNDGLEDIYRGQVGGLPNRLLLGQPDGSLRDASAVAGVDFLDNTRGVLLIDLDNDDDQDLVLALPLAIVVLENDGTGKFAVKARFEQANVFSLAAADYDVDGDLDIYACVYFGKSTGAAELPVPMPSYNARNGGRNVLLQNDGDWEFADVTDAVGLGEDNSRFSFAAIWDDYDNDGQIDLYVANDFGHNNLYHNDGQKFSHVTEESGTANGTFGMSAASGDFNHDGWIDLYKASMYSSAGNRVVTQPQFMPDADDKLKRTMLQMALGNTLFTNDGAGAFRDDGEDLGVAMGRWSWGSIFVDFNNDGWEDLYVTNGFVTGRQPDDL